MPRSTPSDSYLGEWRLVPELSQYQHGEPPVSGTYEIRLRSDEIVIDIHWQDREGNDHEISFASIPDGTRIKAEATGVSHFSLTHISESILDSAAYDKEEEISYARRSASADGLLLATVQSGTSPDGSPYSNFQVYRRID